MLNYLDLFLVALLVTLALTPVIQRFAFLIGAVDTPNKRKVHSIPIPRIGGIAMYIAFMIALVVHGEINRTIQGVILGSLVLFVIGLVDDINKKGMYAPLKLIGQIFAAWLVVHVYGVRVESFSNPFGSGILNLGFIGEPLSIIWIVGITNTINLIDGLDGLAAGVGSISAFTLFLVALMLGRVEAAILLITLFGVTLGFLRYNFSPASIFMGDTGSTFIGYLLAVASIIGVLKSSASLALGVPILALGIPIFDTASAIIRRLKRGQHIFHPDGEHLHHRLLLSGFSQKQAVLLIYYASILLSIAALLITVLQGTWLAVTFLAICFLIYMGAVTIKQKIMY
ncbi:MAG: MraY family glycosyltransferase [Candidatus Margulisiibacteriota bacterium]|jgi:UDP-GlcNAc:undecaprenyl-phosphate GlcNAc-1-phosphate transferase